MDAGAKMKVDHGAAKDGANEAIQHKSRKSEKWRTLRHELSLAGLRGNFLYCQIDPDGLKLDFRKMAFLYSKYLCLYLKMAMLVV